MRAREFIVDHSDQKLDEILPALAAAAAPIAGAVGRGALAAGQALGRGAMAAGNAALQGAQAVGRGVVQGAQKVGNAMAQGAQKVGQAAPQAAAKVTNNIKAGVDNIKGAVQQAGGGNVDSSRLSKTLATQVPGQPMNPQAQKDLQTLLPGIANALMDPGSASQIKQAISTGAKKQAQQQQQPQQQQQKAPGPAGSTPNNVSSYQVPNLANAAAVKKDVEAKLKAAGMGAAAGSEPKWSDYKNDEFQSPSPYYNPAAPTPKNQLDTRQINQASQQRQQQLLQRAQGKTTNLSQKPPSAAGTTPNTISST
jgi:hypothetical protein